MAYEKFGGFSFLTHLQGIFPREALITVVAWERLPREMDPLMALQVVIPVEALRALIALERSFNGGWLSCLRLLTAVYALVVC